MNRKFSDQEITALLSRARKITDTAIPWHSSNEITMEERNRVLLPVFYLLLQQERGTADDDY